MYFLESLCGFSLMMWDVVFVLFISVVRVGSDSWFCGEWDDYNSSNIPGT